MLETLRSERVPFRIAVNRQVRLPLVVALCTAVERNDAGVLDLAPGTRFELCDIEDESALLFAKSTWYRAGIDEVVCNTVPAYEMRSVV